MKDYGAALQMKEKIRHQGQEVLSSHSERGEFPYNAVEIEHK
jgi:hypothetical protein